MELYEMPRNIPYNLSPPMIIEDEEYCDICDDTCKCAYSHKYDCGNPSHKHYDYDYDYDEIED